MNVKKALQNLCCHINQYMLFSLTLWNCDAQLFFFFNGFTLLLILSIHPLPGAYLRLCCFFPQAASQSPSVGSRSIPQLDGMRNIIHPICPGLGWCTLHAWKLRTLVGPPASTDDFPCTGWMNEYWNNGGVDTWSQSIMKRRRLITSVYI